MKKLISAILSAVMLFGTTAFAKIGDKIDVALNTDIVAYINNYAIPSFAVNGTSCVVAEDLRNFGFDVAWDGGARSLTISRNANTTVNPMSFSKNAKTGSFFANILETDIVVYANGVKVTSYAMNGYTMIPIEELTMFGVVNWVEGERALKLWVDGLHIRETMQPIEKYVPKQETPTPTQTTSKPTTSNNSTADGNYYRTPTGRRYHLDPDCGGKNSYKTTNISGLTPCAKCAK